MFIFAASEETMTLWDFGNFHEPEVDKLKDREKPELYLHLHLALLPWKTG